MGCLLDFDFEAPTSPFQETALSVVIHLPPQTDFLASPGLGWYTTNSHTAWVMSPLLALVVPLPIMAEGN